MTMLGKIKNRNGKLYVLYTYDEFAEPFRQYIWWRITDIRRNAYNSSSPEDGDEVTSNGGGEWKGKLGGSVFTGGGSTKAETVERVSIPPPSARGKELRWHDGHWEKLTARGWTRAGEGVAHAAPKTKRTKKTARELDDEIDDALAKE